MDYWNEQEIKPYILQYKYCKDEEERKRIYREHLHNPFNKLIRAQLNTHKFYRFEPYEDLVSEAYGAVLRGLEIFDENHYIEKKKQYVTAFSYFSLVTKQSMFYYTRKKQKHRNNVNIDDFFNVEYTQEEGNALNWEYYKKYTEKVFPIYYGSRHNKTKQRYYALWSYIKEQDENFLNCSNQDYYRKMKKAFPEERIGMMRETLKFLRKSLQWYES